MLIDSATTSMNDDCFVSENLGISMVAKYRKTGKVFISLYSILHRG